MFLNSDHHEDEDEIFCFSIDEFLNDEFDPSDFVVKHLPKVENLKILKTELNEFILSIKEEIKTIIHDDYNDFITFSSSLNGIQTILSKIQREHPKIYSDIDEIDGYINNLLIEFKKQMEKKQESQRNQQISKQLIKIYMTLNNLKKEVGQGNIKRICEEYNTIHLEFETEEPMLKKWITLCKGIQKEIYEEIIKECIKDPFENLECFSILNFNFEEWYKLNYIDNFFKNFNELHWNNIYSKIKSDLPFLKNDYFDLFEDSFWNSFENYLFSTKMKYLYEYRVPSIFQKNYIESMKYLKIFKKEFGNNEDKCDNLFIPFLKKWQLKIYFTLVKQNIIREIEKENVQNLIEKYFEMMKLCFEEHTFIFEISHLFLQLFFSLLQKLNFFLKKIEDENLLDLYLKIKNIENKLKIEILPNIYEKIKQENKIIESSIEKNFSNSTNEIKKKIIDKITLECSQVLKGLRGKLIQLTLMKTIEIPSKYLVLIPLILEPISKHLGNVKNIDDWKIEIVENVTRQYIEMVKEVLQNAVKTGQSLQRLRKTTSSQSETQIIILQMQIDSIEYENQINNLGISIDDIPSFHNLKNIQ
eukprot:gene8349-174_t